MVNNLLLLLTLTGISLQYAWLGAGALYVALVLWLKGARGRGLTRQLWRYAAICLPCYAFFFRHRPHLQLLSVRNLVERLCPDCYRTL